MAAAAVAVVVELVVEQSGDMAVQLVVELVPDRNRDVAEACSLL